jgi:hypothetical protein
MAVVLAGGLAPDGRAAASGGGEVPDDARLRPKTP